MDNLQILSTIGLSLMMLFGIAVRIKIKDNLIKILPAVCYFLLNGGISQILKIFHKKFQRMKVNTGPCAVNC